jgi:hypothetical protein
VNDVPVARQSRAVTEPQREKTRLEYNNQPPEKAGYIRLFRVIAF